MRLSRDHRTVALGIILGFIVLSSVYSVVNPIFESPDEVYHYPYVKYIANGNGLPVQSADRQEYWEQEGSQPPLYYAVSALLSGWINTDDLPQLYRLNPHARIGIPMAQDNKNMIIHTDRERWPWHGTVAAVHVVRFWSILMGAGTLLCTYRLTRTLFPARPELAIGALGIHASIPMFVFISASVNNDNLIILLASISLVLLVRRMVSDAPDRRILPVLGAVVGLACLTKLSGLALVPLVALALAVDRGWRLGRASSSLTAQQVRRGLRDWVVDVLVMLVPAAIVAGWWYIRNWRLYGDPTGLRTMLEIFGRRSTAPTLRELAAEFEGLRISFWGLFGVVNILMRPLWIYDVLDALSVFAAVGVGLWVVRTARARHFDNWPILAVLVAWIGVVFVSLIRWTTLTKASQGRLLYPAISPVVLLMTLGLAQWLPARHRDRLVPWLGAPLTLLALAVPLGAIAPVYALPPIVTRDKVPASMQPFGAVYEDKVRLLGYELSRVPAKPGGAIEVKLYWEPLTHIEEDLSLYIHVFGRDGAKIGQRDSYPGGGMYLTSEWTPDEVICDRYRVPIDPQAQGPVAAEVAVGLYRLDSMANLSVRDEKGQPVGRPIIARAKITGSHDDAAPTKRLDADLGHRARLIGYDLDVAHLQPGAQVPFTLYWRVEGTFSHDYTVFVHLMDAAGQVVGQGDGPPLSGEYPTSFWGKGEILADPHTILVRPEATPGPVRLLVGLYHLESGERVPVYRPDGQVAADYVVVTTAEIAPADQAAGASR